MASDIPRDYRPLPENIPKFKEAPRNPAHPSIPSKWETRRMANSDSRDGFGSKKSRFDNKSVIVIVARWCFIISIVRVITQDLDSITKTRIRFWRKALLCQKKDLGTHLYLKAVDSAQSLQIMRSRGLRITPPRLSMRFMLLQFEANLVTPVWRRVVFLTETPSATDLDQGQAIMK